MNAKPNINVTPLIDVLLVLLIIFMVITPLKPTDFKARIPAEPKNDPIVSPNIDTLVVTLNRDSTLKLNTEGGLGTVDEPDDLIRRLQLVFQERSKNGVFSENLRDRSDLSHEERIEKTVFIKAPRSIGYGKVAKVIDAVKFSGAEPISLQIDDLD
ncbi:MAG: biopolymer transporter ExbD [Pyrinomonadaceae bacterium]